MRGLLHKHESALKEAVKSATVNAAKTVDENFAQATHTECSFSFQESLMKAFARVWKETGNMDESVRAMELKVSMLVQENGELVNRAIRRHNNPQYTPVLDGEPERKEGKVNIRNTLVLKEKDWIQVTREQIILFLTNLLPELQNVREHFSIVAYQEALETNFEQLESDLEHDSEEVK